MKRVALLLALALASSGCITYYTLNKTADGWKPSDPGFPSWQYAAVLAGEVALGTGLGVGAHLGRTDDRDPMNDDGNLGASIAAGNVVVFAGDAALALLFWAIFENRD